MEHMRPRLPCSIDPRDNMNMSRLDLGTDLPGRVHINLNHLQTYFPLDTGRTFPATRMFAQMDSTNMWNCLNLQSIHSDTLNKDLLRMTFGHLGNLYTAPPFHRLFFLRDTPYSFHRMMRRTPLGMFDTPPRKPMTYPLDTESTHHRIPELFDPVDTADNSNLEKESMFRPDIKHTCYPQQK